MEVLAQDDDRRCLCAPQQEGPHGLAEPALLLRLIEAPLGELRGGQRQQVLQIRNRPLERRVERAHPALDPLHACVLVLGLVHAEVVLEEFDHEMERHLGRVRGGPAFDVHDRLAVESAAKLIGEPRLTGSRVTDDGDDTALAGLHALPGVVENRQLPRPPDERGEPTLHREVEARAAAALAGDEEDAQGAVVSLHGALAFVAHAEQPRHEPVRRLAHEDAARRRRRLQSSGEIHGLALRRVVHPEVVADLAYDHRTRVESDAHRELEAALPPQALGVLLQAGLNLERRRHRALGVVLVRDGRAEERHHAVARELVHGPLEAVDAGEELLEASVHDLVELFCIDRARQLGESRAVGEEHGHLLPLAFDDAPGGEDLVGEVLGRVARQLGREPLGDIRDAHAFHGGGHGLTALVTEPRGRAQLGAARRTSV